MKKITLLVGVSLSFLTGAAVAMPVGSAKTVLPTTEVQQVQFFLGGRNYCWYDDGWHGPGFYWCGYAYRRGYGWGGGAGWHGWNHGGPHFGGRPGGRPHMGGRPGGGRPGGHVGGRPGGGHGGGRPGGGGHGGGHGGGGHGGGGHGHH